VATKHLLVENILNRKRIKTNVHISQLALFYLTLQLYMKPWII